jgi:hypothetical protein
MTPWIFVTLGLIVAIGAVKLALMWKFAHAETPSVSGDVTPMPNRRALGWALALVAVSFLTVGYSDMSLWFLPIVIYLTTWVPQVSRGAATPRQSIYVAAAFGAAMIASALLQILVWE